MFLGIRPEGLVQTLWQPAEDGDPIPPRGARVLSTHKLLVPPIGYNGVAAQTLPDWADTVARRYWHRWDAGKGLVS